MIIKNRYRMTVEKLRPQLDVQPWEHSITKATVAIFIAPLFRFMERSVVRAALIPAPTSRFHNIAGKYTGKDDPVMLARVQKDLPATGEILSPYAIGPYVAGAMRGSHQMPLMPVVLNSGISYFDGPPVVSCAAFAMHQGKMTEPGRPILTADGGKSFARC